MADGADGDEYLDRRVEGEEPLQWRGERLYGFVHRDALPLKVALRQFVAVAHHGAWPTLGQITRTRLARCIRP